MHTEKIKEYRLKNKERLAKQRHDFYQKNIERERANCKKWYNAHKESELKKNKEYRQEKRELFDWYHDKERFGGMKQIILDRDNNCCRVCKSERYLSVHHKDGTGKNHNGISKLQTNNDIGNLILLCGSCHHKLHHWQRRNNKILTQDEDIVRTCRKLQESSGND